MQTKQLLDKSVLNSNINKSHKAFTLMEMLITMAVISIIMAVSVPLITQFSTLKTGVDKNVMKCITANSSSGWFTDATGNTTVPTTDPCKTAVTDTQYGRGNAVNTAIKLAGKGSSAQQLMAKKILRAACDQGGEKACDYFISSCWINGSSSSPYCDDTANFSDITYYLHQNTNTNTNNGATYIFNSLKSLLPKSVSNISNEVFNACNNNQTPSDNQNLNANLACELAKPEIYIQGCNNGLTKACIFSYNNNYNKSCKQVKTAWPFALSGNYRLTYNNSGAYDTVNCNMKSLASASITGCDNITSNLLGNAAEDDCTYGWTNHYNRSCAEISAAWSDAVSGTHKITSGGAPPTSPVSTTCTILTLADCMAAGVGTVCSDGSKYAGDYAGYHYFTTPNDESGYLTWNNGNGYVTPASYTSTGATNTSDGAANTNLLASLSDGGSPYMAAVYCKDKSTANYLGHNDWFLPARNEIYATFLENQTVLGLSDYNWSSTETHLEQAGDYTIYGFNEYTKETGLTVRCVRKNAVKDASCATIGNTCTDTSKYIGVYNHNYYYASPSITSKSWNNGTGYVPSGGFVYTMARSATNGAANTGTLVNLTDTGSPYYAAMACQNRNSSGYLGHNDWYLPATDELLNTLLTYKAILGLASGNVYWSSTEVTGSDRAAISLHSPGNGYWADKSAIYSVRCVRKQN